MSVQDDEIACSEGLKGCSWSGIAVEGAATTSADRACTDLSPSVGNNETKTANTKTSGRLFNGCILLRCSIIVIVAVNGLASWQGA